LKLAFFSLGGIILRKEVYMPSSEDIKKNIFLALKKCIDTMIPQTDSENYSENPSVEIETIAKNVGITDIQPVHPQIFIDEEIVNIKHAVLIGTVIFLNINDNTRKQRFSIAHEIYHFLQRWPEENDLLQIVARQGEAWKKENEGSASAIEEIIADYFAANLLIPSERFVLWEDKTDEEIADAFGVEPKCIKERRKESGHELDLLIPKNLSSDVKIEEISPLSLDELKTTLEAHSIHDSGQA